MSVQPGPTFKRYAANGVATVYTIPFLLLDAADLQITLNGALVTTGFTLSGIGNPQSTCTFAAAPIGDLLFQQLVPYQRLADYQNNGDFLAITVNRDFDRLWLAVKQLSRDSNRALTVSLLEPEGIPALPAKAARALKILAFDTDGNPITSNLTLAQLEQQPALALESAEQAAASALSASNSKTAAGLSQVAAANSEAQAQKWAENPEDSPVVPGSFSALHWAKKSAASALETQKQMLTVLAVATGGTLSLVWNRAPLTFRAASLASGTPVTIDPPTNFSLIVPAGATLGMANGVPARLMLLAINNGGAIRFAITNLAGGLNLDETTLISATLISASSNSANVVYSTANIASAPFRVLGFVDIVQPVAGTWTNQPSLVQGAGGAAMSSLMGLGNGQTWQDVTASRAPGTTYTNATGRPISISVYNLASPSGSFSITVSGVLLGVFQTNNTSPGSSGQLFAIVPPGATYLVAVSGLTLSKWLELRL